MTPHNGEHTMSDDTLFGIPAGHPLWRYVRRPCNITTDDKLWCVSGQTKDGKGGGVIAWCFDSNDAIRVYGLVMDSGLFKDVSFGKWTSQLDNAA